jgi:hypothetical protein
MLSSALSTNLTTVKIPSKKTAGSEMAAKGTRRSVELATKPIATIELERAKT